MFDVLVDGAVVATERLTGAKPGEWMSIDYPVPDALTRGKDVVTIRFQPKEGKTAGPVFGVSLFTAAR